MPQIVTSRGGTDSSDRFVAVSFDYPVTVRGRTRSGAELP
jgi:hypothetical protein